MTSESKSLEDKSRKVRAPHETEALKDKILDISRKYFAESAFDKVRLEDIASNAGTSVAYIMRTFNSKEELYIKAMERKFMVWGMVGTDRDKLAINLLNHVTAVSRKEGDIQHVFMLVQGVLSPKMHESVSLYFEEQFVNPLAKYLGGERAHERASIILSTLFGITYNRYIHKNKFFQDPTQLEFIQKTLAPYIQSLIDG